MEPYVHDAVLDMQIARDALDGLIDAVDERALDRYVPFGARTVRDVIAHLAGSDHAWALAAQGLLRGEADQAAPLTPEQARTAREGATQRRRAAPLPALREEMARRRKLLLTLLDLLEPKHLAMRLPSFGEHDGVRERIWLGYHDRLHEADIERAARRLVEY